MVLMKKLEIDYETFMSFMSTLVLHAAYWTTVMKTYCAWSALVDEASMKKDDYLNAWKKCLSVILNKRMQLMSDRAVEKHHYGNCSKLHAMISAAVFLLQIEKVLYQLTLMMIRSGWVAVEKMLRIKQVWIIQPMFETIEKVSLHTQQFLQEQTCHWVCIICLIYITFKIKNLILSFYF